MRSRLTFVAVALSLLTTRCNCSTPTETEVDADLPDLPAVRVDVNCADPANWIAAPERQGYFQLGGGACSPPQYPLDNVSFGPQLLGAERMEVRSSCWRVEEAHEESGWEVGQTFVGSAQENHALVRGFDQPVAFSGRLYRADGTLAYSVAPIEVTLNEPEFLDVGTEEVVALLHPDAWATRFAIHAADEVVATQEVIDGSGSWRYFQTLHREDNRFSVSVWRLARGLTSVDIPLGEGERAILAHGGGAAVVDETLLLFGPVSVSRRLSLPARPLSLASRYHYIVVQFRESLSIFFRDTERAGFTIPVPVDPTARLVETYGDGDVLYYADGAYWAVDTASQELRPLETSPGAPSAEESGAPLFVHDDIVITENGFQFLGRFRGPAPGPQFAGIRPLVEGSRIVHVGASQTYGAAYLVEMEDGRQRIYQVPFTSYCE